MNTKDLLFYQKNSIPLADFLEVIDIMANIPEFIEGFSGDTDDAFKSLLAKLNKSESAIYALKKVEQKPSEFNNINLDEILTGLIGLSNAINDALDEE